MKEETKNRTRWLNIRMNADEFAEISKQFSGSTDRKLSDFARCKLLGKPVKILTRDASMDAATEQLASLRKELSAIANNYNQAVRKLHTLGRIKDFEQWLITYEIDRRKLLLQVEQILSLITELAGKWSL